ncbi:MAG TPA: hypothetical protein VKE26_22420, partial [Xanthobacteraceae bacterium]|nr:hypothetical protein [Xanthobacteraceae bacterium]
MATVASAVVMRVMRGLAVDIEMSARRGYVPYMAKHSRAGPCCRAGRSRTLFDHHCARPEFGASLRQLQSQQSSDCRMRGGHAMRVNLGRCAVSISAAVAALIAIALPASAQQADTTAVAIDNDDIGGVVRGPSGPEAGVWVIAETHDLGVRYIKIVVTDDQGRYVVPDLP